MGIIMKHTISVLVENHAGVLSKVSGLFSRRGFNIESLAVGITDTPGLSRMTIVADGDEHTVEQIEKQLNKMIPVIKVKHLENGEHVSRELSLIKVSADAGQRAEIMKIAELTGAKIIDVGMETLTLEHCGSPQKSETLEGLLKPYGIRELVRTGIVALEKGSKVMRRQDTASLTCRS